MIFGPVTTYVVSNIQNDFNDILPVFSSQLFFVLQEKGTVLVLTSMFYSLLADLIFLVIY